MSDKKRGNEDHSGQGDDDSLPEGWVKRHSKSKDRPYFYNTKTGESVWEKPQGILKLAVDDAFPLFL